MSTPQPNNAAAVAIENGVYTFNTTTFKDAFGTVQPLILEEWPEVVQSDLDKTHGSADAVVALLAKKTDHSKALLRQQLGEIAEVAGIGARGLEGRLLRLLHRLEQRVEPVQETLQRGADRTREIAHDLETEAGRVAHALRMKVPEAEDKMRDNLWTSMAAALGMGMLVGLTVGLTRGR